MPVPEAPKLVEVSAPVVNSSRNKDTVEAVPLTAEPTVEEPPPPGEMRRSSRLKHHHKAKQKKQRDKQQQKERGHKQRESSSAQTEAKKEVKDKSVEQVVNGRVTRPKNRENREQVAQKTEKSPDPPVPLLVKEPPRNSSTSNRQVLAGSGESRLKLPTRELVVKLQVLANIREHSNNAESTKDDDSLADFSLTQLIDEASDASPSVEDDDERKTRRKRRKSRPDEESAKSDGEETTTQHKHRKRKHKHAEHKSSKKNNHDVRKAPQDGLGVLAKVEEVPPARDEVNASAEAGTTVEQSVLENSSGEPQRLAIKIKLCQDCNTRHLQDACPFVITPIRIADAINYIDWLYKHNSNGELQKALDAEDPLSEGYTGGPNEDTFESDDETSGNEQSKTRNDSDETLDNRPLFAKESLPECLELRATSTDHGLAVFARRSIAKYSKLGPIVGVPVREMDIPDDFTMRHIWEVWTAVKRYFCFNLVINCFFFFFSGGQ